MPTIFFDFDSTVCTKESLDEVITLALKEYPEQKGLVEKVEKITNQGMNGELDFMESVQARLAVCPLNSAHFSLTGEHLKHCLTPGFADVFEYLIRQNWDIYIVSGGFLTSILPSVKWLGLDPNRVFANGLRLTGNGDVLGVDESSLLWTNQGKTKVINHLKDAQKIKGLTVLVGDGSNDLAAFASGAVDHFVGFGGNVERAKVKAEAPHYAHTTEDIISFLKKL